MAGELKTGDRAPAFSLPRDGGGSISLKDFKGKKVVLYFFPKADTPGCTRESIDFSRLRGQFAKADTEVIGISADAVEKQDKFKAKHGLKVTLASNPEHDVLEDYRAWGEKTLYGCKFLGVIRKTVLIDGSGRIAKLWPKVSVDGHAQEVLAAAKEL